MSDSNGEKKISVKGALKYAPLISACFSFLGLLLTIIGWVKEIFPVRMILGFVTFIVASLVLFRISTFTEDQLKKKKYSFRFNFLCVVFSILFLWILVSFVTRPNAIDNFKEIFTTQTTSIFTETVTLEQAVTIPTSDVPTETKILSTPTDYIYDQSISIGYIGHSTDDNPKIREILTSLGFSVGKVFLDYYDEYDDTTFYNDLLKYDVIYFPAGWSRYNFEITVFRNAFIEYISSGHGIFVQEADHEGELTTIFLPFDLKFMNSNPRYQDVEAEILDPNHYIFGNLQGKAFSFIPGDAISNYHDDFVVLAQGNITKQPSLLLAKNNLGRIIVYLVDITQMEVDNQNSTLIKNMFNWLNGRVE